MEQLTYGERESMAFLLVFHYLVFYNSSSWLQTDAEHRECLRDSAAECSAN